MATYDSNKRQKEEKIKKKKNDNKEMEAENGKTKGRGSLAAKIVVIALIVMMGTFFLLSNLAYLLN